MKISLSIEYLKKLRQLGCLITIFGVLQFFILTSIATFIYPGGYDYIGYYFSDLGALVARNGDINLFSRIIFTITLTILAISLIPFWLIIRSLFKDSNKEEIISKIGSIFGIISLPFLVGIAFLPFDAQLESHLITTLIFILFFIFAVLLYSVAFILNQNYSNYFGLVGFVLFIIPIASFTISLVNPYDPIGAFIQKIALYAYFIWLILPTYFLWHSLKKTNS